MRFRSLTATSPANAGVRVNFAEGRTYADADAPDVNVRRELRGYLQRLGADLERGIDLTVTLLDIDLAGIDQSARGPSRYRVLNGATPPKIKVRYVLTRNRKAIASGEEWLTDHFYRAAIGMASPSDPLRYEKNLLNDWFRSRFASHLKPGS